jgi:hypothetical protein
MISRVIEPELTGGGSICDRLLDHPRDFGKKTRLLK